MYFLRSGIYLREEYMSLQKQLHTKAEYMHLIQQYKIKMSETKNVKELKEIQETIDYFKKILHIGNK